VADNNALEDELNKLRAEIATLLELPALSRDFGNWLNKLFEFVKAHFGADSAEMRELRTISPELPSEFYDHVSEKLETLGLGENWKNELLTKLNRDTPKTIFDKRLYEYDSFIASLIHWHRAGH
jgi:hypothetical protein